MRGFRRQAAGSRRVVGREDAHKRELASRNALKLGIEVVHTCGVGTVEDVAGQADAKIASE